LEVKAEQWCPEYVTTGFVAEHCGVSNVTVLRWIAKGCLLAFRLPGGHYRIYRGDFIAFLAKYNIPVHHEPFMNRNNRRDTLKTPKHGLRNKDGNQA